MTIWMEAWPEDSLDCSSCMRLKKGMTPLADADFERAHEELRPAPKQQLFLNMTLRAWYIGAFNAGHATTQLDTNSSLVFSINTSDYNKLTVSSVFL